MSESCSARVRLLHVLGSYAAPMRLLWEASMETQSQDVQDTINLIGRLVTNPDLVGGLIAHVSKRA